MCLHSSCPNLRRWTKSPQEQAISPDRWTVSVYGSPVSTDLMVVVFIVEAPREGGLEQALLRLLLHEFKELLNLVDDLFWHFAVLVYRNLSLDFVEKLAKSILRHLAFGIAEVR